MENSTIKTVTISKTPSGKYYISILVEYENQILPIIPKNFLGMDFAMHGLYVASDESNADYPNFLLDAKNCVGICAALFPEHPAAQQWKRHYEKSVFFLLNSGRAIVFTRQIEYSRQFSKEGETIEWQFAKKEYRIEIDRQSYKRVARHW